MIDDLCEDVQRYIVEFCDNNSTLNLKLTNRLWRLIVGESRTNIKHHKNGLHFNVHSFHKNGPVFMPFLEVVTLHSSADCDTLVGLKALNIESIKRRKIDLVLNGYIFSQDIKDFIASISWNLVYIICDNQPFTLKCEILHASVYNFLHLDLIGIKELVLLEGYGLRDYSDVLHKAFALNAEILELGGTLTNAYMRDCFVPKSPNTKRLILYRESNCDWDNFHKIQNAMPNVESFSLQSSNLVSNDFGQFDFSLWTKLKDLDFNYNYTLQTNQIFMKSIEKSRLRSLNLYKCQIDYALKFDTPITRFACSIDLSKESRIFLKQFTKLEHLEVQLTRYVNEDLLALYFYEFTHLKSLKINFMELLNWKTLLDCVRSVLVNTMVQIKQ